MIVSGDAAVVNLEDMNRLFLVSHSLASVSYTNTTLGESVGLTEANAYRRIIYSSLLEILLGIFYLSF